MKCRYCGHGLVGLPDNCPSCGAKLMAVWTPWYRYTLGLGVVLTIAGILRLLNNSLESYDFTLATGVITLAFGISLLMTGMLMRSRYRRQNAQPKSNAG